MAPSELEPGKVWVERHGYCTRCPNALAGTAFMVREKVAWGALADGETCLGSEWKWVPVCEECTTTAESDQQRVLMECGGCGLKLSTPYRDVRVCSRACAQRIARKFGRAKKRFCEVCGLEFTAVRRDARFCSNACRQWTYRLRTKTAYSA
jgi:predicted nucleic acid-binding Zn ribbon protein